MCWGTKEGWKPTQLGNSPARWKTWNQYSDFLLETQIIVQEVENFTHWRIPAGEDGVFIKDVRRSGLFSHLTGLSKNIAMSTFSNVLSKGAHAGFTKAFIPHVWLLSLMLRSVMGGAFQFWSIRMQLLALLTSFEIKQSLGCSETLLLKFLVYRESVERFCVCISQESKYIGPLCCQRTGAFQVKLSEVWKNQKVLFWSAWDSHSHFTAMTLHWAACL